MITPCQSEPVLQHEEKIPSSAEPEVCPPNFAALPVRRATRGILFSSTLHSAVLAIVIWIPGHVPIPVVLESPAEEMKVRDNKPITFEPLPPIKSLQTKSEPAPEAAAKTSPVSKSAAPSAPPRRDYAGPQEIISMVPRATNRVQTILRPDIATPPAIKFPLRLQSMVMIKVPTSPEVAKNTLHPQLQVPAPPRVEIPVMTRTVANPELMLMPVKAVPILPEAASPAKASAQNVAKPEAEKGPAVVDLRGTSRKSAIVLNAVNVSPDPHVQIPNAQLAGNFVVGPPVKVTVPALSASSTPAAKTTAEPNGAKKDDAVLNAAHGSASNPSPSHVPSTNAGTTDPSKGAGAAAGPVKGPGTGITISSAGGGGAGTALGVAVSGAGSGTGGNATARVNPIKRTYGLMITGGGGSGGASRDMGVFGRSEIVYSVVIPMSDAGCPSDWPMQYALLNPRPRGASLLEPPVATKKFAAIASDNEPAQQTSPVFVRGVIDEKGKLVGLQTIMVQDPRGEIAVRTLEKWEFLPALLDGTPVASKVLIGVIVVAAK